MEKRLGEIADKIREEMLLKKQERDSYCWFFNEGLRVALTIVETERLVQLFGQEKQMVDSHTFSPPVYSTDPLDAQQAEQKSDTAEELAGKLFYLEKLIIGSRKMLEDAETERLKLLKSSDPSLLPEANKRVIKMWEQAREELRKRRE